MQSLVWIAAYPKSGSTWLRALLTNYLRDADTPASINELAAGMLHERRLFDEYLGIPSSDLTAEETLRLRPQLYELLAREVPRPWFVTVHDACVRTPAGLLFPPAATAGAIVLVRNPLDIAVSYAHHLGRPIGRTVTVMNRSVLLPKTPRRRILPIFEDLLLSWSRFVTSWLESGLPVHTVRYEDMLADPATAFGAVVRSAGLEHDPARLARAIAAARFDRLQAQEERDGFNGRQPQAPNFFRAGRAGDWRNALTPAQVRSLAAAHADVMARFGYLDEAEAFLAADATGDAAALPRLPA
ncbi:MAG: sulfotransferase domain-containing protein [Acidobacteria bacterium]|nr:sulfotransferase domain-containing protein [Acidobacteriota bacterium]MYH23125.1 sulfotransferase domain-containing protein [Acidobacteriota bacterium]